MPGTTIFDPTDGIVIKGVMNGRNNRPRLSQPPGDSAVDIGPRSVSLDNVRLLFTQKIAEAKKRPQASQRIHIQNMGLDTLSPEILHQCAWFRRNNNQPKPLTIYIPSQEEQVGFPAGPPPDPARWSTVIMFNSYAQTLGAL